MSLLWVAQQIKAAREAAGDEGPRLLRFNPKPPGVIRDGSATQAVLVFLQKNPRRYYCHQEIAAATGRTKVAIDWALIYLFQQELIDRVPDDARSSRYLRYRIKKETPK